MNSSAMSADLRKKYEPQESKLQTQNQEIETLKKQLQDAGPNVSDLDRQNRMRIIDDKTKSLQRSAQDLQASEQQDGQETFQKVGQKVFDVMVTYAQGQGFGLVLDASQQNSGVLWPSPQSDITKVVVDAYNTKFRNSGARQRSIRSRSARDARRHQNPAASPVGSAETLQAAFLMV